MKILFINSVYNWGSTGKIVRSLFTRCKADGIDAAVCYGRTMTAKPAAEPEGVYKFGIDAETKLHAALTRLTGRTGCYSFFSTRRLLRYMDAYKPDIVHLHEPHAYFLNLRPFFDYLRKHNIPLVYTFHCEFAYTGRCGYSFDCEKWKTGCGTCPYLHEYPKTLFFDRSAAMLRQKRKLLSKQRLIVVTPSRWLAGRAGLSILAGRDFRVIRNGIDTENVFHPTDCAGLKVRLGLGDEKIVLSVISDGYDERKGLRDVLLLAEKMQDEKIKFIIVGKKNEALSYPENTVLIDRTENASELAKLYSLCDCFLICSKSENLPTTCLEAVCCGAPVVGYDVGGTAETAPAPLGRFVPAGDTEALKAALSDMLRQKPVSPLFNTLRDEYSESHMYSEYRKIYNELYQQRENT